VVGIATISKEFFPSEYFTERYLCICVFVYLCICVFVYLFICVFVYLYLCICVFVVCIATIAMEFFSTRVLHRKIHLCVCVFLFVYLCICVCVFVFVYLCLCICVFVFVYLCICVCVFLVKLDRFNTLIIVFVFVFLYLCVCVFVFVFVLTICRVVSDYNQFRSRKLDRFFSSPRQTVHKTRQPKTSGKFTKFFCRFIGPVCIKNCHRRKDIASFTITFISVSV